MIIYLKIEKQMSWGCSRNCYVGIVLRRVSTKFQASNWKGGFTR